MRFVLAVGAIAMMHWSISVAAKDLDAVAAAPKNHHIVLENDDVRVLQVEVGPGEVEPIHSHSWPSVMHIESPQPLTDILYREAAGKMVEVRRVDIPAVTPPVALWFPPEEAHSIKNNGEGPFRALRIELKRAKAGGQ
ncbi:MULTISPECIES: cupin domain-containing protein [Sphingobium]|uniref:cupin domain-containing protein n=1 Tax=Sphingobium TaxID=165695 RepID=UPI0015EBADB2|nr:MULTISPECIES: hypothetical protein [Sphingobium]MCW2363525.1 quercetin dioxygenase-like cupin family protein [Sphingobium sp. B10D3B]MCW2403076.1 quercetin dioxygenase-like cupin family protein [Sphingobium sp. B10D7B]MCW2410055.1 quercetin dioxygenase-like cupin family protein [Sphingobium xanthum]